MKSRREFLADLAAISAGALAAHPMAAQLPVGVGARRIDVHHHFASPALMATLKAAGALQGNWGAWSPAKAIDDMEKAGTATGMLSVTTPGVWYGEAEGFEKLSAPGPKANDEARKMARDVNEFGARMTGDHKGRFGLWAALPVMDVNDSLKEIAYAFDTLKADGIGLLTSYGNRWLGDPVFVPIFEELNRRKAIVFVHPTAAPCCRGLSTGVATGILEYQIDTSRTITSWIRSGNAAKFPDVTMIFSHAGGTMPSLINRLIPANEGGGQANLADTLARPAQPGTTLAHLRRFYYDTALSANPVQLQAIKQIAGASQMVFGTDYPFGVMVDQLQGLQKSGLTAEELRGIDRENIVRLMPRFRAVG
jgi:6-methylsalicylate decarboxylase